jgi:hypothetical protein
MVNELIDLYVAATVAGAETALAGRLDTGTKGVSSTDSTKRKLVALQGKTGTVTGYLVARRDGIPWITLDLATLNAATFLTFVEHVVPPGQTLSFGAYSSSGTGLVAVTLHIERS